MKRGIATYNEFIRTNNHLTKYYTERPPKRLDDRRKNEKELLATILRGYCSSTWTEKNEQKMITMCISNGA